MLTDPRKALLYTRVSTIDQAENFSLEAQKHEITKKAYSYDCEIVASYTDEGKTGKNLDRPAFMEMMNRIREDDTIEAILVYKLSRISRSTKDLSNLIHELKERKVALIATNDAGIDTSTAMGELMATILTAVNQMERETILDNAKNGMLQRARNGLWNGNKVFGYDSIEKKLMVNKEQAIIVKEIFKLYNEDDFGYNRITKYLNSRGLLTKKGKPWAHSSIKTILDNPIYIGKIKWENILVNGKHEAIISDEIWEHTREKRKQIGKSPKKIYNGEWLLSGLIRCPSCGSAMVTHKSKSGKNIQHYYICSQYKTRGLTVCSSNLVKVDIVEKVVVDKIHEFVAQDNLADAIYNASSIRQESIKHYEDDITKINVRLKELDKIENNLYEALGITGINDEKLKNQIDKNAREISNAKIELDKVIMQLKLAEQKELTIEQIKMALFNFEKIWKVADFEEKKSLIHSIVDSIHVTSSGNIDERSKITQLNLAFTGLDIATYDKNNCLSMQDGEPCHK